jgi:hypothetical protein
MENSEDFSEKKLYEQILRNWTILWKRSKAEGGNNILMGK